MARERTGAILDAAIPALEETILRSDFLPADPPSYKDLSKARNVLGYEPGYGYEEMLQELSTLSLTGHRHI